MPTDLSNRVFRETRRAVDKFGKHSERELRRIKNIYIGARKRISGEIAENWLSIVKEGTTPFGMERLRGLQSGIDTQLGVLNQDLNNMIPQMVGDAGEMGIYRGEVELAQLLREFPDLHPTFGIINTSAIDVYSGYALQLSQQYTAELTRQIQSALQMGLIDQKTTGQLTTQIRQYLGAEFGKPAKAITYKAQRIARTEMSRAYQAGHEAYGKSVDFIVGEVSHYNPMGPWPCAQCEGIPEGTEFIYTEGDRPPYPIHPQCRCMDADTELFTDDGWKFFKDLTGREMVLSLEPNSFALEWQPIAKIHSYPYSGKLLRFKSKICDLLVTPDHSMFVGCYTSSKATNRKAKIHWGFKSAESLKNRAVFKLLKVVKRQNGSETDFAIGKEKINARLYAKLLGYYLSEGSICKHGKGWYQISIYQNNQERKKKIFEDLIGLPWKLHNYKNKIDIYSHELAEYLIQFGRRSFERLVPPKLKECSADILDVFLDAFCLGDGWIRKGGTWQKEPINP